MSEPLTMTKEREDYIRAHPQWHDHELLETLDATRAAWLDSDLCVVATRAALQKAEKELARAWKQAKSSAEELGISAEYLDTLICAIGDVLHERIDKAEEALAEAKSDYEDERAFIEKLEEESRCNINGSVGSGLVAWIQNAKQTKEVARELLAALKVSYGDVESRSSRQFFLDRATALLGDPPASGTKEGEISK